jgi:hypothetical protein
LRSALHKPIFERHMHFGAPTRVDKGSQSWKWSGRVQQQSAIVANLLDRRAKSILMLLGFIGSRMVDKWGNICHVSRRLKLITCPTSFQRGPGRHLAPRACPRGRRRDGSQYMHVHLVITPNLQIKSEQNLYDWPIR